VRSLSTERKRVRSARFSNSERRAFRTSSCPASETFWSFVSEPSCSSKRDAIRWIRIQQSNEIYKHDSSSPKNERFVCVCECGVRVTICILAFLAFRLAFRSISPRCICPTIAFLGFSFFGSAFVIFGWLGGLKIAFCRNYTGLAARKRVCV